jgi:tripartite-type tricarboxylate transporter receptor subunit TctC
MTRFPSPHRTLARTPVWFAAVALLFPAASVRADSVADFYRGKTVTIDVGYGPGGGYDITSRLIAQFYGTHIPGNPTVIVENVPGGGGLTLANAIYNTAAKDGLKLGVFASDVALEPLYGNEQAQFQPAKFAWIGSMDTDRQSCGVWKGGGVGIKTLPDLIAARKTITFGASSPVSDTSVYPLFFKNALGAPVKVILGYTGTQDIVLAMRRGEVDAFCGLFESSVLGSYKQDVEAGNLEIFVQIVLGEKSPLFGDATPIMDAFKSDEMRQVANFVFIPSLLARPLAAPPGTPEERVAALRAGLLATVKDEETIATAQKMNMTLKPKSGEEVEKMIAEFQATPPELVKKAYAYTHE